MKIDIGYITLLKKKDVTWGIIQSFLDILKPKKTTAKPTTTKATTKKTTAKSTTPVRSGVNDYIANANSYVYHYSWCSSVKNMNEENKVYYHCTSEEMRAKGYTPCGRCNP